MDIRAGYSPRSTSHIQGSNVGGHEDKVTKYEAKCYNTNVWKHQTRPEGN